MESCRYYIAASHVVVHSGGAGGRREEGVEVVWYLGMQL